MINHRLYFVELTGLDTFESIFKSIMYVKSDSIKDNKAIIILFKDAILFKKLLAHVDFAAMSTFLHEYLDTRFNQKTLAVSALNPFFIYEKTFCIVHKKTLESIVKIQKYFHQENIKMPIIILPYMM